VKDVKLFTVFAFKAAFIANTLHTVSVGIPFGDAVAYASR